MTKIEEIKVIYCKTRLSIVHYGGRVAMDTAFRL